MPSQIAAQMFTLRDFTKTPADIAATLKRVRKIGYEAVQVSGFGKIDPGELASILNGEGLTCCVTHIPYEQIKSDPQRVIDDHQQWKCQYTAIGGFGFNNSVTTGQQWIDFAKEYNGHAKKLAAGGLALGYHNHSHELIRFDGRTAMDLLWATFDSSVWMEIDTYWITHGGGDPAAWIKKVSGRIPCVHLKDMSMHPDGKQRMAEIGNGNLNFPGILDACRQAGTKWFVIEQDDCNGRDPFESLTISLRNLKALGVN